MEGLEEKLAAMEVEEALGAVAEMISNPSGTSNPHQKRMARQEVVCTWKIGGLCAGSNRLKA